MAQEPELSPGINHQTGTSYTIAHSDREKLVTFSNTDPVAVTVPRAIGAFGTGFRFEALNLGVGTVTFTPATSTVNGLATLDLTTNQAAEWSSDGTDWNAEMAAKGDTGAQGPTGPEGPQGPAGDPTDIIKQKLGAGATDAVAKSILYSSPITDTYAIFYNVRPLLLAGVGAVGTAQLKLYVVEAGYERPYLSAVVDLNDPDSTANGVIVSTASISTDISYEFLYSSLVAAAYEYTLVVMSLGIG